MWTENFDIDAELLVVLQGLLVCLSMVGLPIESFEGYCGDVYELEKSTRVNRSDLDTISIQREWIDKYYTSTRSSASTQPKRPWLPNTDPKLQNKCSLQRRPSRGASWHRGTALNNYTH